MSKLFDQDAYNRALEQYKEKSFEELATIVRQAKTSACQRCAAIKAILDMPAWDPERKIDLIFEITFGFLSDFDNIQFVISEFAHADDTTVDALEKFFRRPSQSVESRLFIACFLTHKSRSVTLAEIDSFLRSFTTCPKHMMSLLIFLTFLISRRDAAMAFHGLKFLIETFSEIDNYIGLLRLLFSSQLDIQCENDLEWKKACLLRLATTT